MRKAFSLVFVALSCRADCLEEHCLETSQDPGTSWVQMKISKLENSRRRHAAGTDEFGNFYSKRGGDLLGSNAISWDIPQDFSNPAWTWNNELDEQIRHSPLIDGKKNIYVAGTLRLRKFSPEGKLLWLFNQDEPGHTSPVLGDGLIYFRVGCGNGHNRVYALDMETGKVVINKTVAGFDYGADSPGLLLTKNRLFLPASARSLGNGGCDSVLAMNASTGDLLWSYTTDDVMWNMAPTSPDGGDSVTFSSSCGVFHRISAAEGQLMVKSEDKIGINGVCGTGGGTAGPNGLFYAAHGLPPPDQGPGFMPPGSEMFITAYNITTGEIAWRFPLEKPYEAPQSPAVGYLYEGGPLAVVAAIGQNTGLPPLVDETAMGRYLADADLRHQFNVTVLKNAVIALDAATGAKIWQWNEADWDHFGAAGDEEGWPRRIVLGSIENPVCLPDNQGIPLINTKAGVVIASSSHSGNMTLIRDANKNGIIEDGETTAFAPGVAFLNGPSSAPDMLVASPCWGPMYVFRE